MRARLFDRTRAWTGGGSFIGRLYKSLDNWFGSFLALGSYVPKLTSYQSKIIRSDCMARFQFVSYKCSGLNNRCPIKSISISILSVLGLFGDILAIDRFTGFYADKNFVENGFKMVSVACFRLAKLVIGSSVVHFFVVSFFKNHFLMSKTQPTV